MGVLLRGVAERHYSDALWAEDHLTTTNEEFYRLNLWRHIQFQLAGGTYN